MVDRWAPISADVTSKPGFRSVQLLRGCIAQFDVEQAPRYQPGAPGVTWCNVFVWDCTRALGCEIPHWVDADGQPAAVGKGTELTANALQDWLGHPSQGGAAGWMEVDDKAAYARSLKGFPTVVSYKNPGGHGHIAILLNPRAGEIHIAQAGRKCLFDVRLADGFSTLRPLRFFTHD